MKKVTLPDGRMIKGGWVAPPNAAYGGVDFICDQSFYDVKESGVNLLFPYVDPVREPEDFARYVSYCKKYNVYTMATDHRFADPEADERELAAAAEYYRSTGVVFGVSVCDEPGRKKFSVLSDCYKKYKKLLGNLCFYINHMPMYAGCSQINGGWWTGSGAEPESTTEEYSRFIDDFCSAINIPVLSYDFYPFRWEKGIPDKRYYEQLVVCREKAEKYDRSLWNFTQLTSWNRDYIRNTEYTEIAWLNNTSLAFGVVGLQYFCYWTPTDAGGEKFLSAMITRDGKRTKHYAYVKKLNAELSRIESFFLKAEHKGVVVQGDAGCSVPESKIVLSSFGALEYIDSCGVIVGCFNYEGKNMYYVVNGSPVSYRTAELRFTEEIRADVYEHGRKCEMIAKDFSLVLDGGEGVLIVEK